MEEFIKNVTVLGWIMALAITSVCFFIISILQKKSDKGDQWFLASCMLSLVSLVIMITCGLALFEEKWVSLGKRFMLYLFFIALVLACFIIGRYKLKKETTGSLIEEEEEEEKLKPEKPKIEKEPDKKTDDDDENNGEEELILVELNEGDK